MDINRNNYETSFLLYLDGELNSAGMVEVEKFLSENADLQKEFELLQHTVLLPEEIIYEHKELLFHKEERRRVIPIFWIRIAVSILLLITAGWFILTKISNARKREIVNSNQSQIINVPVGIRKDSVDPDLSINNHGFKRVNNIPLQKVEIVAGSEKGITKKSEQSSQSGGKRKTEKNNPAETALNDLSPDQTGNGILKTAPGSDEAVAVMQKSNAASDIQPEGVRAGNDPKQISAPPGKQAPVLVLAATASKSNMPAYEKSDLKDQDFQSDNAISVVALNDQNKSIIGFFKKLAKQTPDNDKSENARKVSVSVFQLSY